VIEIFRNVAVGLFCLCVEDIFIHLDICNSVQYSLDNWSSWHARSEFTVKEKQKVQPICVLWYNV